MWPRNGNPRGSRRAGPGGSAVPARVIANFLRPDPSMGPAKDGGRPPGTSRTRPGLRGMKTTAALLHDIRWRHALPWLHCDPRMYQIATLGSLIVYGLGWLGFDLPLTHAATIHVPCVRAQPAPP